MGKILVTVLLKFHNNVEQYLVWNSLYMLFYLICTFNK